MSRLWLDRETWNTLDLKVVGTYVYADTAEDLLISYALDNEPAKVWDCTCEPAPADLLSALADPTFEVWAHNAQFDKAVHNGRNQRGLPCVVLERWRCSMAHALSHALPASLADLCKVLKVPADIGKLSDGKKLVRLFTQPQPGNRKILRATRATHPAEWERFKQYAINDITAMRECVRRMPTWNWDASCIAEWHQDQRINERGFQVDTELTKAGARAAITEKARIASRFAELSQGAFTPGQREKFRVYLSGRLGYDLDNTQSGTFQVLLRDPAMSPDVREMMQLAIASNKTSTAKYAALDPAVSPDGRFRGGLQFAGAGRTRRWAGRLYQAQNLPSRGLPPAEVIEDYIEHLKLGTHALFFEELMLLGAAALRGCVVVPEKKKMVVADLSNIEGRVLAWIAREMWKLQAFREYDAGTGPDLYNITAVSIIGGDPWKVEKKNRNAFGKVPDLASGYQGGVAGYQTFARAYGLKMSDFWDTIQKMIAPEHVNKARENLNAWGRPQLESLEIDETEWVASETCKLAWRARHPATKKFWYDLGGAAKNAIQNVGVVFSVGPFIKLRVVAQMGQRWLVIRLPGGRFLTYFDPHITDDGTLAYWGEAAEEGRTTRQWVRVFTHGGKLTGNCCQTIARDILAPSLTVAEQRGYKPILSVHDEVLTEVPDTDEFNAEGLVKIMATNPVWAPDLPLAAAGFETYRYKKD